MVGFFADMVAIGAMWVVNGIGLIIVRQIRGLLFGWMIL